MNNQTQFARPFPPGVCAIGRPANSSLGRAAASSFDDQKTTHRGLGARHDRDGAARCDALFPAHRQGRVRSFAAGSVSLLLLLTQLRNLAGGFGFRPFSAEMRDCNRALANLIHNTADHPLHNAVEPFKRHFSASVSVSFKPSDGVVGSDQEAIGVYQNDDCAAGGDE